jgi:hypothetical protein
MGGGTISPVAPHSRVSPSPQASSSPPLVVFPQWHAICHPLSSFWACAGVSELHEQRPPQGRSFVGPPPCLMRCLATQCSLCSLLAPHQLRVVPLRSPTHPFLRFIHSRPQSPVFSISLLHKLRCTVSSFVSNFLPYCTISLILSTSCSPFLRAASFTVRIFLSSFVC